MVIARKDAIRHILFALYRRLYLYLFWNLPFSIPPIKRPHYVELELTNNCNFSCVQCFRKLMNRDTGYMKFELFRKLIDEIASYPLCYLRVVGMGESSLHPQLKEIMGYLKQKKIKTEFTTNGTIFKQYTPDEILDWNLDHLAVSVDGTDASTYNKIRINGDYSTLKENVMSFYSRRQERKMHQPFLKIRNVIFPLTNQEELDAFKTRWLNYSDMVTFNIQIPTDKVVKYDKVNPCNDIFFTAHVRWDGRVPLCSNNYLNGEEQYIGDLNNQSLRQVWKSKRLIQTRKMHKKKEYHTLNFCEYCYPNNHTHEIIEANKSQNKSRFFLINLIGRFFKIT